MTRFGMEPGDFKELAGLMAAVMKKNMDVKKDVGDLRRRFLEMRYCWQETDYGYAASELRRAQEV